MSARNRGAASALHPRVGVGVLLADDRGRVLLTLRKLPLKPAAGASSAASWIIWRH
jgi:hypothetical protein